jgi:hypothetical protein
MLWICRLRRRQSLGRQELIGRSDSLERLFGSTVAGVSVGVTPEGGLPKGALDLGRRRTLREAKRGMGFATVHCQSLLLCSLIFAQILAANMGRRIPGQVSTIHWHGMPVPAAQDGNEFLINGKAVTMGRAGLTTKAGQVELWEVVNPTDMEGRAPFHATRSPPTRPNQPRTPEDRSDWLASSRPRRTPHAARRRTSWKSLSAPRT